MPPPGYFCAQREMCISRYVAHRDTHGVAHLVFSVVSHPPTPGEGKRGNGRRVELPENTETTRIPNAPPSSCS